MSSVPVLCLYPYPFASCASLWSFAVLCGSDRSLQTFARSCALPPSGEVSSAVQKLLAGHKAALCTHELSWGLIQEVLDKLHDLRSSAVIGQLQAAGLDPRSQCKVIRAGLKGAAGFLRCLWRVDLPPAWKRMSPLQGVITSLSWTAQLRILGFCSAASNLCLSVCLLLARLF